ncbi:MAG: ASKHA domain-containing protein [Brevinematales bacterium]|jgi:uncharacterized 2Fe-2S/4Fe-4S cluster protein (DUF4445 family)
MKFEVTFLPSGNSILVPENMTVLAAARKAGVLIESPCNGAGTCGKCRVVIGPQTVLACETQVKGNIKVEIPDTGRNREIKIIDHGKSFEIELDRYIVKKFHPGEKITYVFAGEEIISKEDGDTGNENYGIVVDIGTTTVVVCLTDIAGGKEIDTGSILNPQSPYAQDVLSRIKFAASPEGLDTMFTVLMKEINTLISSMIRANNIRRENIYEIVFSGNTTMLHLATGTDPSSLGKYPYIPVITGGNHIGSKELGLSISDFGLVYLPPVMSAYVGADITSGILASRLYLEKGPPALFIDIGTNGEMVLSINGSLIASSTAAGPAFEGMNISCGMRAGSGAIEVFDISENDDISYKTIGNSEASGICGSGLIDIVGEFAASGIISKTGRFSDKLKAPLSGNLESSEGKKRFKITENVSVSQKDIRQVQLAKGAIRAGIELLLRENGVSVSDVSRVLVAGSFGFHLRPKSLINIGLLPPEFDGKIEFLGNTSKSGGQAFLLNKKYREDMKRIVKGVKVLELANCKNFEEIFVKELKFELATD